MEQNEIQKDKSYFQVAEGVWGLTDIFTNVYVIRNDADNSWVLIDAGLKTGYGKIKKMVGDLFGENARPSAILLTHGHFDHTGSLKKLAEEWDVPVYAHYLELPYLQGKSAYPPPDPSVGGGLMSYFSEFYPKHSADVIDRVGAFPGIGHDVPGLPEWKYMHTPGHSPGHVSFWREKDKVLIAGDAFVTTVAESAFSVMTQSKIISGPPKYFTCNWLEAESSVEMLASLLPEVVATGHGKPMNGKEMQQELLELAYYFQEQAVPKKGRYVMSPAITDSQGVVSLPKEGSNPVEVFLTISAAAAVAAIGIALYARFKNERSYRL
ncbi:MBL fold metallo-hydrolase [Dyadobacter sp. Leaf189]|uniref:MBL fold metallo-hydrolase n=1 Tax=Dyadobacter sp. Leaf189 TaxID=1736295 RepID=UPI0006F62CF2|nr:MBL fold metallo-hydrolase [Dyadobacter sp. Leaf189]KQS26797.1 MBL fold metallo-hydrolase [Dyadobacter sp. Leaf189]